MDSAEFVTCEHFAGEVTAAARDLIGRRLIVRHDGGQTAGLIVETEAYGGVEDPASHAAFRPGGRAALMAGPPGTVYIYSAYGVYPCFNIVTGPEGSPSAVLIRSVVIDGHQLITSGPGRLTRAMGILPEDHGQTICGERFGVSAERIEHEIVATPRIGISRGIDLPWRFVVAEAVERRR